jgi:hypothetical protein
MPPRRFFFIFWGEQQLSNYIPSQKFRVVYCKIPLAFFFGVPPPPFVFEPSCSGQVSKVFFFFPSRFSLVGRHKRQVLLGSATLSTLLERDKTQWNYEISLHTFNGISRLVSLLKHERASHPSPDRENKTEALSLSP